MLATRHCCCHHFVTLLVGVGLAVLVGCSSTPSETDEGPISPTSDAPATHQKDQDHDSIKWAHIASGRTHSCAIKDDQTLWCWGRNDKGQLGIGNELNQSHPRQVGDHADWRFVTTGSSYSCAIKDDRSLWCWGLNHRGQLGIDAEGNVDTPRPVGDDRQWQSVAAGGDHSCAIKDDQSLWCWGNYENHSRLDDVEDPRRPQAIGDDEDWASLSAGQAHTCAIKDDDTLWCWGRALSGQLGLGDEEDRSTPTQVNGDHWNQVSAGSSHSCAIATDHSLWCWGNGTRGKLGLGDENNRLTPTQVSDGHWTSVSTGQHHSCATDNEDQLACWGFSDTGQLGLGDTERRLSPTVLETALAWREVAAGGNHSCAIANSGQLHCWGSQIYGQLGNGVDGGDRAEPTTIDSTEHLTAIEAGPGFGCALTADGDLKCWGANARGQLGFADHRERHIPNRLGDATWAQIAPSTEHREPFSCGIKDDGTLWCWGANGHDQLGIGSADEGPAPADDRRRRGRSRRDPQHDKDHPTQVGDDDNWRHVTTGAFHACALRDDNTLWCWGDGPDGRLGLGEDIVSRSEPTQIGDQNDWKTASAGDFHTCALREDDSLWCWGQNTWGQLGLGHNDRSTSPQAVTPDKRWQAVTASHKHTCAIADDRSLWCWGEDAEGQLGLGTQDYHRDLDVDEQPEGRGRRARPTSASEFPNTPRQVGEATDWTLISAGRNHTCGIRGDQSLWCWGDNGRHQLADADAAHHRVPHRVGGDAWRYVSAGPAFTLAIRDDGLGVSWGWSSSGQLGDGTAWVTRPVEVHRQGPNNQ